MVDNNAIKEQIKFIIIHCSDTPDTSNLSASDIHKMHLGLDGMELAIIKLFFVTAK